MRFPLVMTATVAWALWLGGIAATFVFGLHLFHHLGRDAGGAAANDMFHAFAPYEMVLAGVAIVAAGMALVTYPNPGLVLLLGCLLMAGALMLAVTLGFMPQMDELLAKGQGQSPEFTRWHGRSMIGMTVQAAVLLLGAFTLPRASRADHPKATVAAPRADRQPVAVAASL